MPGSCVPSATRTSNRRDCVPCSPHLWGRLRQHISLWRDGALCRCAHGLVRDARVHHRRTGPHVLRYRRCDSDDGRVAPVHSVGCPRRPCVWGHRASAGKSRRQPVVCILCGPHDGCIFGVGADGPGHPRPAPRVHRAGSYPPRPARLPLRPLLAPPSQTLGWRGVAWTMAGIAGAAALPVLLLLRERPVDVGLSALGAAAAVAEPAALPSPVPSPSPLTPAESCGLLLPEPDCAPQPLPQGDVPVEVAAVNLRAEPEVSSSASADAAPSEQQPSAPAGSFPDKAQGSGEAAQSVASASGPPVVPPAPSPFFLPFLVLREIAPRADFWLLAGSFFVCGASTNGLIAVHLIPACIDAGMPEVQVREGAAKETSW